MKLVTFIPLDGRARGYRVGAVSTLGIVDLASAYVVLMEAERNLALTDEQAMAAIPPEMIRFMEGGAAVKEMAERALNHVLERAAKATPVTWQARTVIYPRDGVKLLSPVPRPTTLRDTISFEQHMKNSLARIGLKELPKAWYEIPGVYRGNHLSVIGTDDPILAPSYSKDLDYELEFGVFIGKRGRNISKEQADDYIYGYSIFNDVSARDVQGREMSLSLGPYKSKHFDNGNVIGPYLVTADEVGDAYNLRMIARVNGEVWSDGNSGTIYWKFPQIIEYLSREETLYPGDFIGSGTVGFGCGLELGEKYLKPGDVIELEVEKLGILRNKIVAG